MAPQEPVHCTISQYEEMTRNAGPIQDQVLRIILDHNASTEYLRNCGLNGRTDAAAFKKHVPIVSHSDLKPYFDRIAQGDRSAILMADPIQRLSMSSGTTSGGQQKYLVLYKEILEAAKLLARISGAYRARAFPIRENGRVMELVFCGKMSTTSGGLPCATATTHLFRSKEFKQSKPAQVKPCSPEEVVLAADYGEAMYCHLLCGLLCADDVQYISSTFAYIVVEALRAVEWQWPSLCHDIRSGQLSARAVKETGLRSAMAGVLARPDPALADHVTLACEGLAARGWRDAIPAIWPNCKYILSIMTGSMAAYLGRLRHYAGDLPLISGDYGSTEGWIGVNANPKAKPGDVTYTMVPTVAYYEFIPLTPRSSDGGAQSRMEPVGMTEVEIGQEYELLLTTYGGLYRYKLGDVVRITGFLNSSPTLAYVCRKNVLLTVNIDKNTEKDLQMAVDRGIEVLAHQMATVFPVNQNQASRLADKAEPREHAGGQPLTMTRVDLVDYTSYADLATTPGHYIVFWELGSCNADVAEGVLQRCASAMDASFVDPGYVGSRKVGTIGPLELCVVRPGTFRHLLERYISARGAAITQYKTPRCTTADEQRSILRSNVCLAVFSSAYQAPPTSE